MEQVHSQTQWFVSIAMTHFLSRISSVLAKGLKKQMIIYSQELHVDSFVLSVEQMEMDAL